MARWWRFWWYATSTQEGGFWPTNWRIPRDMSELAEWFTGFVGTWGIQELWFCYRRLSPLAGVRCLSTEMPQFWTSFGYWSMGYAISIASNPFDYSRHGISCPGTHSDLSQRTTIVLPLAVPGIFSLSNLGVGATKVLSPMDLTVSGYSPRHWPMLRRASDDLTQQHCHSLYLKQWSIFDRILSLVGSMDDYSKWEETSCRKSILLSYTILG